MKFQTMMVIKAVVCLVFGVPIILVPGFMYSIFGMSLDPSSTVVARQYGAALIGLVLLTWFGRNVSETATRWAITLALFVYDALGFIVWLMAALAGAVNALGWSIVLLYLLLAIGFGYFLVKQPQPVIRAGAA